MVKAGIFLFPFLKELFLGKSKDKDKDKKDPDNLEQTTEPRREGHLLRQSLIGVAIVSAICNVFFVQRIFSLGSTVVSLKREIAAIKQQSGSPNARPSATVSDAAQAVNSPTAQEIEENVAKPPETPTVLVAPAPPPEQAAALEVPRRKPTSPVVKKPSSDDSGQVDRSLRRLQRITDSH